MQALLISRADEQPDLLNTVFPGSACLRQKHNKYELTKLLRLSTICATI